jgi:hypothetical protein
VRAKIAPGHQLAVNLGDSMSQRSELSSSSRQGNQYTVAATPNFLSERAINLLSLKDDEDSSIEGQVEANRPSQYRRVDPVSGGLTYRIYVVLELLSRCGMILRARLRTSLTDGRCRRSLNFRVHYSFVIICTGLNLSEGSRV